MIGSIVRFVEDTLMGYILGWDKPIGMWLILGFDGKLYNGRSVDIELIEV